MHKLYENLWTLVAIIVAITAALSATVVSVLEDLPCKAAFICSGFPAKSQKIWKINHWSGNFF